MQLYKNSKEVKITCGSRSHHFNKRRLAKVWKSFQLSPASLLQSDKIDAYMQKCHTKQQDYSGHYGTTITKHRLQTYFVKGISDKKNQAKSDKTAADLRRALIEDDWIDELEYDISHLISMPECNDIDTLINALFTKDSTAVITHDKQGEPLHFWRFQLLSQKHPYEISAKWFSQRYDRCPAWTGTSLIYCNQHNSMQRIRNDERWIPKIHEDTEFIFCGDFGAHQEQARRYVYEKTGNLTQTCPNVKKAMHISKYRNIILVRVVRHNQRTAFKSLFKHYKKLYGSELAYYGAKNKTKANYRQREWLQRPLHINAHYVTLDGSNLHSLYKQLDSMITRLSR